MSRRGDDEGFHPHPGDPWHPGWASRDEAEPEAEPEAEREPEPGAGADEAGPGEPVPAPGSRRRHFGRGRRREHLGAGATEGPSGDETGRPGLDDALPAGWWAPGAALDETTWEGRAATAPDDAGDEDGEEEEAAPSAPLFPWWGAGAAPEAPTVAAVRPVSIGEALDEEPAAPGEEPGAASLVPLDLPARPAVLPAEAEIEEEGREARLDLGEEPDAAGVAADLDRAVAALLAEMGEESVVESLEESAAGEAEVGLPDLPWVVEGPGAEPGYLPEVGVPEEGSAAGGGELPEVGLPDLPWVVEGPGAEPGYLPEVGVPEEGSAAGGGELPQVGLPDLPWVVEGPGAEPGYLPEVGVPEEGSAAGGGELPQVGLPDLPWVVEDPGAEPGYLPEVGVPEEGSAAGGGELPEEGLAAPSWAPDVPPALEGEDVGFEPSGLVLASWEPAVDEFAAGTAASGAEPLPAVSEGPSGDSGMPTPEAEVDEWLAFVEGMPVGTTPAPPRAAPSPIPPAGIPDFDFEVEAVPPAAERQRPGGWFGRRRRRGTSGEEGWPERAWAAESAEAAEGDHQPPPWPAGAAAALPQEAVAAPESDEEAEAEAAFATWQSGDSAGAPEAEAAPSSAARPGPAWAEPEADQGDAARGEDWALPGPAGAVPLAPGEGGASAEEEAEEAWEEAEWTGEPEAAAGWPAEVDEDEVEVPSASLPEEEWETGDELTPAAPEGSPRWPGSAPQAPEVVSEAEWAEAGWEVFPEPGEPLPPETGALPGGREPLTAQPAEVVDELEAAGWETFPEPGRRPPRRPEEEAGGKPGSPVEPAPSFAGPAEPVFPEPYPARTGAEPTMESPPPDVFDFASPLRRQRPISEEILSGAVTMEHRGLAEEVAAADTAETELQALSAPMPGLESGVVGFEDVAHLSSDEEMAAPMRSDLPVRVVTGMVLAALLLGSLWVGGEFFAGFVGLLVMLGLGEFYGSLRRRGYQPLALFGFLGGSGLLVGTWFFGPVAIPIAVVATTVVSFFYYAFSPHRRDALTNGGLTILGMLWVTGTAAFAFPIAASPEFRVLVLAVAATVIATDVGAFFAGRAWGARPMAPVLSPRKTWEGLAGGVVLGIGAAVAAGYFFDPIGMRAGAALGLVVAIMAPLGDLAESMVKRSLGIKDMGTTLPGHGGILDRLDAFLFVLPAAWVLFETMGLLR